MAGQGRKKYRDTMAAQARTLCEAGMTDTEIAVFFGVALQTIVAWKAQYPEFLAALIAGKAVADDRVERAYYQRAVGYEYTAEKIFCQNGEVTRVEYLEHVPPDPGAAFRWLCCRRPDRWTNRRELSGPGGGPLEIRQILQDIDGEGCDVVAGAARD